MDGFSSAETPDGFEVFATQKRSTHHQGKPIIDYCPVSLIDIFQWNENTKWLEGPLNKFSRE